MPFYSRGLFLEKLKESNAIETKNVDFFKTNKIVMSTFTAKNMKTLSQYLLQKSFNKLTLLIVLFFVFLFTQQTYAQDFSAAMTLASGQDYISTDGSATFTVTFSEAIDPSSFTASDINFNGSTSGTITSGPTATTPNTVFQFTVSGAANADRITPSVTAGSVNNLAGVATNLASNILYAAMTCPTDYNSVSGGFYGNRNSSSTRYSQRVFLAQKSDGTVAGWGGSTHNNNVPTTVTDFVKLSSGQDDYAGLRADGSIEWWGYWADGPHGLPTTAAPTGTGWVDIVSAVQSHTALKNDGTVQSWGYSYTNSPSDSGYVKIMALSGGFIAIKADGSFSQWGSFTTNKPTDSGYVKFVATNTAVLGIKSDGSITAWGSNTAEAAINAPTDSGYVKVFSNQFSFVAMKADGSLTVWGRDGFGGPGDNPPNDSGYVNVIPSLYGFTAIKADGSLASWGGGTLGTNPAPAGTGYKEVKSTYTRYAAINSSGALVVWGGSYGTLPGGSNYERLFSSGNSFAALTTNGSIADWGETTTSSGTANGTSPTGSGFVEIVSTGKAFAALHSDGSIQAWGSNLRGGAAGNGGTPPYQLHTSHPTGTGFVSISGLPASPEAKVACRSGLPISVTVKLPTDTDGDGVYDIADLDDDNDGILDSLECNIDLVSNGLFPTSGGNTNTVTGWTVDGTYAPSAPWNSSNGRVHLGAYGLEFRRDYGTTSTATQNISGIDGTSSINLKNIRWYNTSNIPNSNGTLEISYDGTIYATIDTHLSDTPTITAQNDAQVSTTVLATETAISTLSAPVDLQIKLPSGVAASGDLVFNFIAGSHTSSVDDLMFSEVSVNNCPDTDGDGIADNKDLDSDNDGIPDNIEAQITENFITTLNGDAATNNGLDSAYGTGIVPVETTTGTPDHLNLDTDSDGIFDIVESGLGNTEDPATPGQVAVSSVGTNGLVDSNESADDYSSANGTITDPLNSLPNLQNPGSPEVDYKDNVIDQDSDGDGVYDIADLDDDNDGISDTVESAGQDPNSDADADGIPLYLDDDDNDPAIGNTNGLVESAFDYDGDGLANHLDIDSDNDTINDIIEAEGTDADNDGEVDYPTAGDPTSMIDADNDGLDDSLDTTGGSVTGGTPLPTPNSDSTGGADFIDEDSDDDNLLDSVELVTTTDPKLADTDGDGENDDVEVGADPNNPLDGDGDGL